MTQINPYAKPTSVAFKCFEMAVAGTTRAKIVQVCEKAEIGPERILRELKLEDFRNITWSYKEDENSGSIKISNLKSSVKAAVKKAEAKGQSKSSKPAAKAKAEAKPEPKSKKVVAAQAEKPEAEAKPESAVAKAMAVEAKITKAHAKREKETGRCGHCGCEGHFEATCELAKGAKAEIMKEAKRRDAAAAKK